MSEGNRTISRQPKPYLRKVLELGYGLGLGLGHGLGYSLEVCRDIVRGPRLNMM